MALFDGSIRIVVGDLGKQSLVLEREGAHALGWTTRPVEDSIEDCGRSLDASEPLLEPVVRERLRR